MNRYAFIVRNADGHIVHIQSCSRETALEAQSDGHEVYELVPVEIGQLEEDIKLEQEEREIYGTRG